MPKKILFFGDSIFRRGFDEQQGFIHTLNDSINADNNFEFIKAAIGGNKIYDLLIRFHRDAANSGADVIVINTGTNDVNHKFTKHTGTDQDKYESYLDMLLTQAKQLTPKVILCNIAVAGEDISDTNIKNADVTTYCKIIQNLAAKHGAVLCDIRAHFTEFLAQHNQQKHESGILTSDGIHLNADGNKLYAHALAAHIKAAAQI